MLYIYVCVPFLLSTLKLAVFCVDTVSSQHSLTYLLLNSFITYETYLNFIGNV